MSALYDESIVDFVRVALLITLKISAPILLAGVAIGLIISIIQSVTQIQEQTLVFVPKIFAMMLVTIALLHWIIERLVEFSVEMFSLV